MEDYTQEVKTSQQIKDACAKYLNDAEVIELFKKKSPQMKIDFDKQENAWWCPEGIPSYVKDKINFAEIDEKLDELRISERDKNYPAEELKEMFRLTGCCPQNLFTDVENTIRKLEKAEKEFSFQLNYLKVQMDRLRKVHDPQY